MSSSEVFRETIANLGDHASRITLRICHLLFYSEIVITCTGGTNRTWLLGVDRMRHARMTEKGIRLFLRAQRDRLTGMGQIEPIQVEHDRKQRLTRDAECHQGRIEYLLVVLTIKLEPPRIPCRVSVGSVALNVPWRTDRTIRVHHHAGKTRSGNPVQHFIHIE